VNLTKNIYLAKMYINSTWYMCFHVKVLYH